MVLDHRGRLRGRRDAQRCPVPLEGQALGCQDRGSIVGGASGNSNNVRRPCGIRR